MIFEIPLIPEPQTLTVSLSGTEYRLTLRYKNADMGGWQLDIADQNGAALLAGIPLVTGADLLAQYEYLNFPGQLQVVSDDDPDAVPTFDNLGVSSHLLYVTP